MITIELIENIELKENNFMKEIIESIPYYIYVTDLSGGIRYINSRFESFLQQQNIVKIKNAFEMPGILEFQDENGKNVSTQDFPLFRTLKYEEKIENLVLKFNNNGTKNYISFFSSPIYNDNKFVGAINIMKDVTDEHSQKKKLQNERENFLNISTELRAKCDIIEVLRKREQEHLTYLKHVINNISEGIMVFDSNGKLSLCNKAVYSILKLRTIELIDDTFIMNKYEILDTFENVKVNKLYDKYFKFGIYIKNRVLKFTDKKTNETKYIEINSNHSLNKDRKFNNSIITLKDVTETKLHEINSEEQARFINDVVNTVDVPIAVLDYPQFKYKLINKKYKDIIEYINNKNFTYNEAMDRNVIEILKSINDENGLEVLSNIVDNGLEYTCPPYCIKDDKGRERYYKMKFIPYENKDKSKRLHVHGVDVTEEINHNLELEKVTRLKDEFFTVISHELRTPLTIIYSSLQLTYDVYKDDITPNMDKTLSRISQNCIRLLKLTNNILDISKAEAGFLSINNADFDVVDLSETIVRSVNTYAVSKGIELIFDTNEEECSIQLDKDKYEKILLNLLSNAIKFTPEEKTILVQLDIYPNYFELIVKDEGIGIPEDKIDSIFDRFAQVNSSLSRRAEGTGLGLSLVKKLIELMNGTIHVNSVEGKGSEFIVRFNRVYSEVNEENNYVMISENIRNKINLEFSDIN